VERLAAERLAENRTLTRFHSVQFVAAIFSDRSRLSSPS
jgi:hypothetical protein